MIISTKGRYGVRAMFALALNSQKGPVSIKNISESQSISETYLEQIFAKLRQGGLVTSIRGAGGGYQLARAPKEITVGEILKILEGPLAPAECVIDACENAEACQTQSIWCRIYEGINQVVDSITLGDMLEDYEKQHRARATDGERCK